ncbi:MAG: 16S rRNA (adenine(1518)-N(6)/adenine(1519)-N(6))-dimethyltransferase RsmA [Burkholderiales bacterium]
MRSASHTPRKRFGQHFLHDARVLARIVEAIAPRPGDAIVEIGPGEGALTRLLLERVPHIAAIEIDRDLASHLEAEFPRERLTLHRADALRFDFATCPAGARLVGNLPYNISTPLLFRLAEYAELVRDMHFMLQLEVVDRMVAKASTPAYGRLSVMLQTRFSMQKLFRVAPGAFRPPPKVESAVVRLIPLAAAERPRVDERIFARVVAAAFSARRKTLRNALPLAAADFAALAIDPGLRPENLAPSDYVRIAQRVAG